MYDIKPHAKNPKRFYLVKNGFMVPFARNLSHKEAIEKLNAFKSIKSKV